MIRLFTDTSANLPLALVRRHSITVVPFSYTLDGALADYSAETDFDGRAYYEAMRGGAMVQTSMINPAAFVEAFEPAIADGDDVLYVGMSGGISGTAAAAALAVRELKEKYPTARAAAIDTYAASLGEGLQVLDAAECIAAGMPFDALVERLEQRKANMCQFFTVDDLNFLKRNGRLSGATAMVGTMLGIKPILRGDETGHIVQRDKVRGMKRAMAELARLYDERALDKSAAIGIAHADAPADALHLTSLLRERGFTGECLSVYYEPVTGSHVGPGTVALFFWGTEK